MVVLLLGLLASAADFYVFDFDGTLVETRAQYQGTFRTPVVLSRRDGRTTAIEPLAEGPEQILIFPDELNRIRSSLAPSNETTGDRSFKAHLRSSPKNSAVYYYVDEKSGENVEKGISIFPGDYYFDERIALKYFADPDPRALVSTLLQAQQLEGQWKGPYFSLFAQVMADSQRAQNAIILSSRGHPTETWNGFFRTLQRQKEIASSPNPKHVIAAARPEYEVYGKKVRDRKPEILYKMIVDDLERTPLSDADIRLNSDGEKKDRLHLLVIAEDNPEDLDSILEKVQRAVLGRYVPFKLVVLNAGNDKQVSDSGRPRMSVMKRDGSFRKLTKEELETDLKLLQPLVEQARAKKKAARVDLSSKVSDLTAKSQGGSKCFEL